MACLLFAGCSTNSGVKSATSKSAMKETATPVIDHFFKQLSSANAEEAISGLLSNNDNIITDDSSITELKAKLKNIGVYSGKYVDYSLLKEKEIQGNIAMYSFLVRYEKKYYRFIFEFYNNGTSIKIYKFRFDDALDIEIEESLKLYN